MSEKRQIARAAGLVGALTVVSRVTGLVRDIVVGYLFGAGTGADAFFVAYRIPNLLRRLVAEGAATAAFIPVFTGYLTRGPRAEADRVARVLLTVMALVLAAVTLLGIVFAGPVTALFAPGFAAVPGKLELTIRLTRVVFPYIFCVGMVAAAMGVLNSLRDFWAPAMSPVVMNVVMIVATVVLAPWLGIYSLAVAVLLGGLAQMVSQLPALRQQGIPVAPLWVPRHPAVKRVGALMLPTVLGSAVYQFNVLVSTMFASLLPAGSVAFLWYAERLFEFPLGVFAVALSTAALPSFAALAKRDLAMFRDTVGFALRLVNVIALPAAVGLALTAEPLTSVLFVRGQFTPADAAATAIAVRWYSVGLWSVACVRVLVPAFYALEDTRTPVVTAIAAFFANLLFVVLFIGPLESPPDSWFGSAMAAVTHAVGILDLRHGGLALSTSLAATVNLVLLAAVLSRRTGGFAWGPWLGSVARTTLAAAAMVPVVRAIVARVEWFDGTTALGVRVVWLLLAVVAGTLTCAAALNVVGGAEIAAFRRAIVARLGRRVAPRAS
ncbi:MAG: murein biosynthesis integral membrane protein MurJ [Polyangiaceae bacterium UTPRO1]|jgi:putative peptidoglycan lipid II flippase|nr:murein biosynthesis integral membrane protein MurJ [Myxococcales bacterium]OQY64633.1 MAG: murein biosynthesis integral membrane protein MurJ [Polyangiaceae bacterium UTPRO1]